MNYLSIRQISVGLMSAGAMLGVYFGLISLLSGFSYALSQWNLYYPYVLTLAIGFGLQMSLYLYLREARGRAETGAVAASGATGAVAMVACCAHHLTDFLPILGLSALATLISSSQIQLFWIGIAFNLAGLIYISRPLWYKR